MDFVMEMKKTLLSSGNLRHIKVHKQYSRQFQSERERRENMEGKKVYKQSIKEYFAGLLNTL